jgi:uncharacterized protein
MLRNKAHPPLAPARTVTWAIETGPGGVALRVSDIVDGGRLAAGGLTDFVSGFGSPAVRLGVTGLSNSGKTVFITALLHALLERSPLPVFEPMALGRVSRCYLEPQPDDDLARFEYEEHVAALTAEDRHWPESTRRISQLRLTFEYEPRGLLARLLGRRRLHVDIVDYPGEWLLDLPLMQQSYAQWSAATMAASCEEPRASCAGGWRDHVATLQADGPADEQAAMKAAEIFTAYLASCRKEDRSLSMLPPGRFLMPGDYAGSPLLAFAPLDVAPDADFGRHTLGALMARRYQSYIAKIVKPFFFGYLARLDRQIVLVDALTALNAGAGAVNDLRKALTQILACFRQGSGSIASYVFGRRVERILFAATKADLLHHRSHDRLEAILKVLVEDAMGRAEFAGAKVDEVALAAIRATREAVVRPKGETLDSIVGTPESAQSIGGRQFDGETEAAIFPGDLPKNPREALDGSLEGLLKFVRFRPPQMKSRHFPHIRLDRSIEFLIGDRFG